MRVLTEIGEQGITIGERELLLRPSLYAMTTLGEPEEIVDLFTELYRAPPFIEHMPGDSAGVQLAGDTYNVTLARRYWREMLFLSWRVICACAESPEETAFFIGEPGQRYGSYRLGKVPAEQMLVLARSLMYHGCIGKSHDEGKGASDGGSYSRAFDALHYVSLAIAHLGMSESNAWSMTMSGFQAHWEAKHGKQKERRYESEHDATMDWLKAVNKLRDPQ